MEPEPTDEIETIEDLGPESVELAAIDPDPMLMPLDSTEISFQTLKAISQTEFVPRLSSPVFCTGVSWD